MNKTVTITEVRKKALSFPESTEEPHFEKTSFRFKKKIFATFDAVNNRICVKLSEENQSLFSLHDSAAIFPVPNKWGKQGWTFVDLSQVKPQVLNDILETAYQTVSAVKKSKPK